MATTTIDLLKNSSFETKMDLLIAALSGSGGSGVPNGAIIMWSGTVATIPDGFSLCDGSNGTPDLRNRFVIGAGSNYAVGATGGSSSNTQVGDVEAGPQA